MENTYFSLWHNMTWFDLVRLLLINQIRITYLPIVSLYCKPDDRPESHRKIVRKKLQWSYIYIYIYIYLYILRTYFNNLALQLSEETCLTTPVTVPSVPSLSRLQVIGWTRSNTTHRKSTRWTRKPPSRIVYKHTHTHTHTNVFFIWHGHERDSCDMVSTEWLPCPVSTLRGRTKRHRPRQTIRQDMLVWPREIACQSKITRSVWRGTRAAFYEEIA